jgi:hypothetical protein
VVGLVGWSGVARTALHPQRTRLAYACACVPVPCALCPVPCALCPVPVFVSVSVCPVQVWTWDAASNAFITDAVRLPPGAVCLTAAVNTTMGQLATTGVSGAPLCLGRSPFMFEGGWGGYPCADAPAFLVIPGNGTRSGGGAVTATVLGLSG